MKKILVELLKVKSILSIIFSLTTCFLAIKNIIHTETFMGVTMAIITYYFTRKCNNKNESEIENDNEE